ncbi:MAG: efflux RND transporter periplasmic adaptor subunit [Planctomycetes bacterium]|nr:efflux RND transporter periplasmic adaptor subunit [Planctomycetota bacterium]
MRWSIMTSVLLAGCHPHGHDHGEADKEQERKTAQITVWSERHEIFLEHELPAANRAVRFVTHVTDLTNGQPRREGKLTFVLTPEAGNAVEHVEQAPKRPGIYIPEISFPRAGAWRVAIRIPTDGLESLVELSPIIVYATPEEAAKAPDPETAEGITFLKEQQWMLRTAIEAVGNRRMVERLKLPGTVLARPGGRAHIAPPIGGRLIEPPGEATLRLGRRVSAGELLAFIQPPISDWAARMVEAEAEIVKTKLAVDQAEIAHARMRKLVEGQARAERELQESEYSLHMARATHQAALALKAAYEKSGAAIRSETGPLPVFELKAPIAGTITNIAAGLGEFVAADRAMLTILNTETVLIEARVPEVDVARIGKSAGAVYETPEARGRFVPILGESGGRLLLFGPEVDPATRSVPLIYEVGNAEGRLKIGGALNVYLETARAEEAIAIPETAIVDEEGRPVAFVQVSGETFQRRDLTVGIRDSGFVQVLEGLAAGERVVTRGAYAVRLASASSSIPAHGHPH